MTEFIITITFHKYNEIKHSIFLLLNDIFKSMTCTHISFNVLLTFVYPISCFYHCILLIIRIFQNCHLVPSKTIVFSFMLPLDITSFDFL